MAKLFGLCTTMQLLFQSQKHAFTEIQQLPAQCDTFQPSSGKLSYQNEGV
jgi:hypothetical protein